MAVLSLAALAPLPAHGQASNDEARLTVGVVGGWIGGTALWSVNQPVFAIGGRVDEFLLVRDLRGNIAVGGQLTYFPSPRFGWTGEISYTGLGTRDGCRLVVDNGDQFNRDACNAIDGRDRAASAVSAMGGAVYRLGSRTDLQPYIRGNVGLSLVPRSTTAMIAFFGADDDVALPIYFENESRTAKPTAALSIGIATAPSSGYQFRFEVRGTAVQLDVVDRPVAAGVQDPSVRSKWVILPSLSLGLDVVLEKRRGRRY
jgi:hypothetical protein